MGDSASSGHGVEKTNPTESLKQAIDQHYDDEKCGAPIGTVIEEMIADNTINLADAASVIREGYYTGTIYQPTESTVALVTTDGGLTDDDYNSLADTRHGDHGSSTPNLIGARIEHETDNEGDEQCSR